MRVLHLIPSFGSGGAERQLSMLAPELAKMGIEVHLAYRQVGPNLQRLFDSGVSLHRLKTRGNYNPRLFWEVYKLVRSIRPDIIQTWIPQMDIVGGIAALANRVPYVLSERASAENYSPGWKANLRLLIGRLASRIVANSKIGSDYWRPHLRGENVEVIRNFVTPFECTAKGGREVSSFNLQGRYLVLFAGRFWYQKNIPVLLEAMVKVAKDRDDVVFIMFGEGPERDETTCKIEEYGLSERIIVNGYTPHLYCWMKKASVFVSVSHYEGHPNVVLEAAEAGCPLVLSDIAAHREIFDSSSAQIVSENSSSEAADAIINVLDDGQSANRRSEVARSRVSELSMDNTVGAYIEVYRKITRNT